jgi:hypothetical protein
MTKTFEILNFDSACGGICWIFVICDLVFIVIHGSKTWFGP